MLHFIYLPSSLLYLKIPNFLHASFAKILSGKPTHTALKCCTSQLYRLKVKYASLPPTVCSSHYTAKQIKNCTKSTTVTKVATMKIWTMLYPFIIWKVHLSNIFNSSRYSRTSIIRTPLCQLNHKSVQLVNLFG